MVDHIAIRDKRRQLRRAVTIGITLLVLGCANSPEARLNKSDRRLRQVATALVKRGDADSLAAAGLLRESTGRNDRNDSMALIAKATAAAPERPELEWLQAQDCQETTLCDPEPIERRLRELDPSNGAGWMGALVRANSAQHEEAKDAALAAISRSDRVDIYWTTLIARLSRATAETKMISLDEAEISIIGVVAARAIPGYAAASNACKGERLRRDETVEICRGVARAFERGDTYITEMIGVAIAKRVWTEDSPQWKAAAEARRVFEYRARFLAAMDLTNTLRAEEYLALCEQNRREQDVFRAQLISAGRDPNPPPE